MKRLTLLVAALTMVLGLATSAMAAPEVTVSGNMLVQAMWWGGTSFDDDTNGEEAFRIFERFDLAFTATASENLKAVIVLRSGRTEFGQNGYAAFSVGGGYDGTDNAVTGGNQLGVNQAYLDFNVPSTSVNVKAGYMPVALPGAVAGSPILDDNVAGILASSALTDNVSLALGWLRFDDDNTAVNNPATDNTNIDGWVALLPLSFEGVSATPFFVYSDLEQRSVTPIAVTGGVNAPLHPGLIPANLAGTDELENAWWIGSDLEISILDPFIIKADVNYGEVNSDGANGGDRGGWYAALGLDYTGFDFATLSFAYAYTSGLDSTNGEDDRLPVLSDGWQLGTFFFGGVMTGDDIGSTSQNLGFHALGASATGISFFEGLTHDLHLTYAWGNNDDDTFASLTYGRALLEDETMFEVSFNTFYQIYDELKLYNGLSWINLDADESDWAVTDVQDADEDAYKLEIGIRYDF